MSLTTIVKLLPRVEALVGTKPEKKPPARGWQGSANEDWETVSTCLLALETKFGVGYRERTVLWEEVELNRITRVGGDIIGCVGKTILSNGNLDGNSGSCGGERQNEGGCVLHICWFQSRQRNLSRLERRC